MAIAIMPSVETRLKKAHITLINHPETSLYAGVIMHGVSTVVDNVPTACTDGIDVRYGRAFMEGQPDEEFRGVVLHEVIHKVLRHLMRHKKLMEEDPQLANAAMDYVDNAIILGLKDKTLAKLPAGALYDKRFEGWSVLEVYRFLKTGKKPNQPPPSNGTGSPDVKREGDKVTINGEEFSLGSLDEHDPSAAEEMSQEELSKHEEAIEEAIRQGSIMAGRFGTKAPRAITESLAPHVDWKEVLTNFVSQACSGRDEYTYRKYSMRHLVDDNYAPGYESEQVGEVIVAIDTSGSISQSDISEVASHLANLCSSVKPEKVRVLWWDTQVHGEQIFDQNSTDNIRKLLKPQGGGGTRVSCVREYLLDNRIKADCMIVFTDGYVEHDINWRGVNTPTLWLVNGNERFVPPMSGKLVIKK